MFQPIQQPNAVPAQINQLRYLLNQALALDDWLDPMVSKYELKSSEYLFGVSGTLVLLLLSIILRPQIIRYLGLEFVPIIGIPAVVLGLALGLFLFRGPSRWRMERNLRKLGLQLAALRTEVNNLDGIANIPINIRRQLWSAYEETIDAYRQIEQFSHRASNYPFIILGQNRR